MLKKAIPVILLLSFPFAVDAATIQLPKTGQTTCYDAAGNTTPCPGSGQDGAMQVGAAWPSPRFADSNGTITDNLTDLVWLKNADCFGIVGWQQALDQARTLASGQCGLSDNSTAGQWRLPNRKELLSLTNFGQGLLPDGTTTWLQSAGFTGAEYPFKWYWSSDTYPPESGSAAKWVYHPVGALWADNDSQIIPREFHAMYVRDKAGAALAVTPGSADFGQVGVGSTSPPQTFTLTNSGTGSLTVTGITVVGPDSAMFTPHASTGSSACSSLTPTLAAGAGCTVTVTFTPATAGAKSASLHVASNSSLAVSDPALTGTGTQSYAVTASVSGGNGTITPPASATVASGTAASFTLAPAAGYQTSAAVGGTCPAGSFSGNMYATGPVVAACTVNFSFIPAGFSISTAATPSGGGNVVCTPVSGNVNAAETCTVAATAGYRIGSVTGCNGSLSGVIYSIPPLTENCTVSAVFEANGLADVLKAYQSVLGLVQLTDLEKVSYDVAPLGSDGKPQSNGSVDVADVVIMLIRLAGVVTW